MKKCGRCEKTVYPTEELKCLDKVWHKMCFKCQECGMTLNMRNYKGFNKLPYCEAHIPKAKATTVAETPELRRIAENTKLQSNIKYHADFERAKGKFTQVADDPETLRIRQNTKIISNVVYHGEYERKAAMEQKRLLTDEEAGPVAVEQQPQIEHVSVPATSVPVHAYNQTQTSRVVEQEQADSNSPYSARQNAHSTLIYTSQQGPVHQSTSRRIGSIADYDPINEQYGSIMSAQNNNIPSKSQHYQHHQHQRYQNQKAPPYQPPPEPAPQHRNHQPTGRVFRAMYDYMAGDYDEVTFQDGDMIINASPIDEGWMTGTVQRTGQTGMLPANYVEPVN